MHHLILLFRCIGDGTDILMNIKMEKLPIEISQ